VQANDVKRVLIPWESCSTMGEYSSSYFESPIMDVFPYFSEEEDLEKLKSLMHLKQLDLKLQQIQILWNSLLKKKRLPKISINLL
jgi:hypothetical protein